MIAKKRLLPILMAILMVFAMMPMTAGAVFAESDTDTEWPEINTDSLMVTLPEGTERVTAGDTVAFSINISDDREVRDAYFYLRNPVTGKTSSTRIGLTYSGSDPTKSGVWTGEFTVTDETENGTWQIYSVNATDTSGHGTTYYNENIVTSGPARVDMSAGDFEVVAPECPFDLTTEGYSMMLDGSGATTAFGGNYYVNTADDTVTPTVKVRYDADDETWTTLAPRKYTLKYEKKTGENSWEDYTADTFGVDEDGTATYRVSATGKESLYYTGTVGPVEFNVIKKHKVTFDTHGGSKVEPQYVIPGEKASKPTDPTKEGMFFGHWFSDEQLTNEYSFSSAVNGDITLYADWYANMALGIYNDSNPNNTKCGTVDIETSKENVSWQDARTMNFTVPEGDVKFTAKAPEGYRFKGFYKGVIDSSGFVKTPSDELLTVETEYTCGAGEAAICAVFECTGHQWEQKVQKATPTADGRIYRTCEICGAEEIITPLLKVSKISLAGTSYTYIGKAITPKVTVANASETLSADNYTVTYSKNTNVGTATAKVTLKGDYYEGSKSLTFTINKATNPLKMKPKTATVKFSKLKKKAQTLAATKVIKFTKQLKDKKTYTLSSAKKGSKSFKKYFKVNKTTGKVTVKKGLKKGTYKVKVKVKAAGNANYKASAVKSVTFTVKVK